MKILHLMLASFYIDGFSYQENLLPKYHKLQGNNVKIVASLFSFDQDGNGILLEKGSTYFNEDGISVTRLEYQPGRINRRLRRYKGLKEEITGYEPDIIFIHGIQFLDIDIVKKYALQHHVKIFADNHADYTNSGTNILSKYILHRMIWRRCAQKILPFTTRFYGVLPVRADFLISEYKIPKEKVSLLVMGADDAFVLAAEDEDKKLETRKKYHIEKDDFLIVYGGKTDHNKLQVLDLMDAVNHIESNKAKLLIFGSVLPDIKESFEKRLSEKIKYIGWMDAKDSYDLFAASHIVCFPGRHSVFWEQCVAQGIPMIVKKLPGTTHVDLGGNVYFLSDSSEQDILEALGYYLDKDNYQHAKEIAMKERSQFLYSQIAKKSIEE